MRIAYVKKPQGMRPLGRRRHIWKDNIKTDIKQCVRLVYCLNLAQDKVE